MRFFLCLTLNLACLLRASFAFEGDALTSSSSLVVNEFLASAGEQHGIMDEDGQLQEWVEIYNKSGQTVNLQGWTLTDDPSRTNKWIFPAMSLGPREYIVVLASAKDRTNSVRLHTNFKLSARGEYLGFFDTFGQPVTQFTPAYPEQRSGVSFGLIASNYTYLSTPTPGFANTEGATYDGVALPPRFSVPGGFFRDPVALTLSGETPGSDIRYTLDGSEPSTSSQLCTGAIMIASSPASGVVTVRAASFKSGYLSSKPVTQTYIFPKQVLFQSASLKGFPSTWNTVDGGSVQADYEMDQQVLTNSAYETLAQRALTNLPSLSLVLDVNDLFGQATGIYANPGPPLAERAAWERAASVQYIQPDGRNGFSLQAGLRIQGGTSRDPNRTHKHSFRLFFRGDYGDGELKHELFPDSPVKKFNTLILDAGLNLTWTHRTDLSQRPRGQYVRDQFVSDVQLAMGYPAAHGKFVHLYLNGLYWGIYNLHERPDEDFAAAVSGGAPEDYDVIKNTEAFEQVSGNSVAWNAMMALANADLENLAQYEQIKQYLDVPAFIDYLIANLYSGNDDWPFHNWYAFRKREASGRFRFVSWDAEHTLKDVNYSALGMNHPNSPGQLFAFLRNNAEFRLLFADHVQRHFFEGGILYVNPTNSVVDPAHPENNMPAAMYLRRIAEIDPAIVLESARWGDNAPGRENLPYTRNVEWLAELNFLRNSYFPKRSSNVVNQFRTGGLYPNAFWVTTPTFNQQGGSVPLNFALVMANTKGTIYFTTNGTDPRVYATGAVSADAQVYRGPWVLDASCVIKARALSGSTWSALNSASFQVAHVQSPVRITEIMYNPLGGSGYEFIEIQNAGNAAVDLSGCTLSGVAYSFPAGSILNARATWVLASSINPAAFAARYPNVSVFGYFNDALSNGGERITLREAAGRVVDSVAYDDESGWPSAADGSGASLDRIDPAGDSDDPANWRASISYGTPGVAPASGIVPTLRINEVVAGNTGGSSDWIELLNAGATDVDIGGWSCTDDSNARKFVFPTQTIVAAGGYLLIWCDTNSGLGIHSGFNLDRQGETVSLHDGAGTRVDGVSFGNQIAGRSIGRVENVWQLTIPTPRAANVPASLGAAASLRLNEWMASAPVGANDWVEIHNASDLPVSLGGHFLTAGNGIQFIRRLTFVPPHGHLKFVGEETPGVNHLNFKLSASGETLVLNSPDGREVDRVAFGPQIDGLSEGRWPDGSATIASFPGTGSPGATNYIQNYVGPRLNEIFARNATISDGLGRIADWIELHNPGSTSFSMDGMSLSTGKNMAGEWRFPNGTVIGAGSYLVVWCDSQRSPSLVIEANLNTGLSLEDESGAVCLFNINGQLVDSVEYGQQIGRSIGRVGEDWRLMAAPTLGAVNSNPASLGSVTALRFNEWLADNPTGSDWFEIYNGADLPVNMGGLFLTDDASLAGLTKFRIPALSFVDRKGWIVWLADDEGRTGRNHVNFNLSREGESLRLYDQNLDLLTGLDFGLQQAGVSEGCIPDGGPAVTSFPSGATPRAANEIQISPIVFLSQPSDTNVVVGLSAAFRVSVSGASVSFQWYFGSDRLAGNTNATLVLPGTLSNQAGHYWVMASNAAGVVASHVAELTVTDGDSDGDGLLNSWELDAGLDPFNATDAHRDVDGDGMSNLAEFLCGTDPRDSTSVLRLQTLINAETSSKTLRFTAMPNRTYSLQCQNGFGGAWVLLKTIPPEAFRRVVEVQDPEDARVAQRFYRINCEGLE